LKVRILAVWQPMLLTDWGRPTTSALARLRDRRVEQFWDPGGRVATAVARAGSVDHREPSCCERKGALWDLAAVYHRGSRWDAELAPAAWWDGPVAPVSAALEKALRESEAPPAAAGGPHVDELPVHELVLP
jgi:hypothetical protein